MAVSITEGSVEVMHSSTISAFGESSLSFGKSGSQSSMNWHKCFIRNRDLCLGLLMMYNVQSNQWKIKCKCVQGPLGSFIYIYESSPFSWEQFEKEGLLTWSFWADAMLLDVKAIFCLFTIKLVWDVYWLWRQLIRDFTFPAHYEVFLELILIKCIPKPYNSFSLLWC